MDASYGIVPPAYRLPAASRVGAVRLQVSDLQQSIDYYTGVIGLRVIRATAAGAALGVSGEATTLVELREQRGAHAVPRHGRLGLYHFAILLPDRAALAGFVAHLGAIGAAAATADHAVSEAVYLWDPDGLGIEVYADRPRSAWRTRGRELYMTTERLNVAGLLHEASGREWNGLPAGTTIGHMHLHVGDLAEAEAFYHRSIGLDKVVWSYPGALFLSAGGYHHHLGTNVWAAGARPAGEADARLLEWDLVVPAAEDVDAVASSCSAAGFYAERTSGGCTLADPWGSRVRITNLVI